MDNRDYDKDKLVFFIDVREPSEIQKLKEKYNAEAILIKRSSASGYDNAADKDANFDEELYDRVITNDGTLEQLELQARELMKNYRYNKN